MSRLPMRLVVAILWLLAAGGTGLRAQKPEKAKPIDVVVTAFGWPLGMQATVESYQRMIRGERERIIESTYELSVEGHPEGLRVRRANWSLNRLETHPFDPTDPMSMAASAPPETASDLVITTDGIFLNAEGVDRMVAGLRALVQPMLDSITAVRGEIPELVSLMLSEDWVTYQIAEHWGAMVEGWIDAELDVGEVYTWEEELPSPARPDVMITMVFEASAVTRLPCTAGDLPNSCVQLELRSSPNASAAAVLSAMFEDLLLDAGAPVELTDMVQHNVVRVVARPESLIPYRYEISKDISWTMVEDGERTPLRRLDETVLTFDYERSAGGSPERDLERTVSKDVDLKPPREAALRSPSSALPTFIPYDTPPSLRNAAEVQKLLQELYPRDLKEAGRGGRVELWLYIDEVGRVQNAQVKTTSGLPQIDEAALRLARRMLFHPAQNYGAATDVWVTQWISFEVI